MGNIIALFTGLHGRIARKPFWIGTGALFLFFGVVSLAVTFVMLRRDPFAAAFEPTLGDMRRHGFGYLAVILIILYPSLAVLAKRLQDLNWPGWIAVFFFVPSFAFILAAIFGLAGTALQPTPIGRWAGIVEHTVHIVTVLALGIVPGTKGPNRYGPDPG